MGLTADTSDFEDTLEIYLATTSKVAAKALNNKARDVAYRAAQATPVATDASIRASLLKDKHLLASLTSIYLKEIGAGKLHTPDFKAAMEKLIKIRQAHKKYLRSGWAPAIEALGGSFRGGASFAGIQGYANKATGVSLLAEIVWINSEPADKQADSAEEIAGEALQKGIDYVTQDMEEYIQNAIADIS